MLLNETNERSSRWSKLMAMPYVSSAVEVIFALLVSNAAIFISIFVILLMKKSGSFDFWVVAKLTFGKTIKTSEVLVYILGFLSPAVWIIVNNIRAWRHVGFLLVLVAAQLIVVISTGLIFALSLANVLSNTEMADTWAWGCLIFALGVWYATLVYEKKVLKTMEGRIPRPRPGSDSGSDLLADLRGGQQ